MSIFITTVNELSTDEAKSLGAQSSAIKEAGCHDLIIKKCYETTTDNWSSMTVEFETPLGETIHYSGFFGTPKDSSAEAVDKANQQTKRTMADISRIVKAAGIPSVKEAAGGAVAEVDDKGRKVTVFTKLANKKLVGTTYTLIDGQKKDGQIIADKVFVKQELDTLKFLTKDGKDGMGRDCRESFDADSKNRIEIAYGYDKNAKHIATLNKLLEKQATPQASAPTQAPLAGMPQPAQIVTPVSDDI